MQSLVIPSGDLTENLTFLEFFMCLLPANFQSTDLDDDDEKTFKAHHEISHFGKLGAFKA